MLNSQTVKRPAKLDLIKLVIILIQKKKVRSDTARQIHLLLRKCIGREFI